MVKLRKATPRQIRALVPSLTKFTYHKVHFLQLAAENKQKQMLFIDALVDQEETNVSCKANKNILVN